MPRKYIKKKNVPAYSIPHIQAAVCEIINKTMTYKEAEAHYGVPTTVIFNRIAGRKNKIDAVGQGRHPVLSKEVEDEIAKCLNTRSRMGYPCDKEEMKRLTGEYINAKNLKTPFKDGTPGNDWYLSFMKRYPKLSLKKAEHLQKSRQDARDPFIIYDFYDKLENIIAELQLDASKFGFLFNADETGFPSDPSQVKGIGEKGVALSRVAGGSGKENTTVLVCVSADGSKLPPLIVFKGGCVQSNWTSDKCFPGTLYAASQNGWMEEPQFYHWFANGLIPHVNKIRTLSGLPDQAALLIDDGHSSHISIRIIEL